MNLAISHPTDRPNFSRVDVGDLTVWFSYRTPIGFHHPDTGTVTRVNDWGPTTGRHLAEIDGGGTEGRRSRLPADAFLARLNDFSISSSRTFAPAPSA